MALLEFCQFGSQKCLGTNNPKSIISNLLMIKKGQKYLK